jgi:hypothetical protein
MFSHPSMLAIPSAARRETIVKEFLVDLESYTLRDEANKTLHPISCCVCDGIPTKPQWSCMIHVERLRELAFAANMEKTNIRGVYPDALVDQYTAAHDSLKPFVLSPASYIDKKNNEILICKGCKSELELMRDSKKMKCRKTPPLASIMNGYLLGDAPVELTCLSEVELALVSRVRIYCRSWVFFGGCHRQIQGWHTFFKNRHSANVANLEQLQISGLKGLILVVLCGPFTSTQRALTLEQTAVDPNKVIAAYKWLIANNIHYKNDTLPEIEDIPIPQIIEEDL